MAPIDIEGAEVLKAQANELHKKGENEAAYKKYSEAIKKNPQNAILYANRAASCLAMKEYLDAASDAQKATDIDPKYAKAWGRLGTAAEALSSWSRCIEAWEHALSCLPATDELMSPAEKVMKKQFEIGLKRARSLSQKLMTPPIVIPREIAQAGRMPWDKAQALEKQYLATGRWESSVFVILGAYREFIEGVEIMKTTKVEDVKINGSVQKAIYSKPMALVCLTNGIMQDERTFHINFGDWMEKYNRQVIFEAQIHKGWIHGGSKVVREEAPQRLKQGGWEPVRRALSVTVRAWIMRAFLQNGFEGNTRVATEFYARAVEVLEWGRKQWPNVSKDDRGVIFEKSFIRGVKRLQMAVLHKRLSTQDPECDSTMEDLADMARDMISDVDADKSATVIATVDFAHVASFWIYAKAEALSILGWCHMQSAFRAKRREDEVHHLKESAIYYQQAAELHPKDDEHYSYLLHIALDAYWFMKAPLRETLPICKKIRLALPEAMAIWQTSSISQLAIPYFERIVEFETEHSRNIFEGRLTLDSIRVLSGKEIMRKI